MNNHTLLMFCFVTMTQTFSIGPAVTVLLTRYFNYGFWATLPLSLVFRCGESLTLFVAFSITSGFHASPTLFIYMKGIGGLYLIYLGIKSVQKMMFDVKQQKLPLTKKKTGFVINFFIPVINPKSLIYFISVIPPFIIVTGTYSYGKQFFILSLLFLAVSFTSDMCFILIAAIAQKVFGQKLVFFTSGISSVFLIGTGIYFTLNVM